MAGFTAQPGAAQPGGFEPGLAGAESPGPPPPSPELVSYASGSYSRDPVVYAPGAPSIAPTAVPVSNTTGNWMIAVASWRQDAGQADVIRYPSTVSISDDADNFWIPVYVNPGQGVNDSGSIIRCSVWMAPAARAAEYVFFAPTAYQSALVGQVFEFSAACPWYQVEAVTGGFENHGTSIAAFSVTPGTDVFAFGVLAWDNISASVTITSTGWTALNAEDTSNGNDHTGDMYQAPYWLTGSGSEVSLSATSATTMDWAGVAVVISGIGDTRVFPYVQPLQNWPVLITEIAASPVISFDPTFAQGSTYYAAVSGATVTAVASPLFQPIPTPYQPALYGSLQVTPDGTAIDAGIEARSLMNAAEAWAVTPGTLYTAVAWVYSPLGWGAQSASAGFIIQLTWLTASITSAGSSFNSPPVTVQAGEWTQLTLPSVAAPETAAWARLLVYETAGSPALSPVSAVFYVGYAAFSVVNAYEAVPPDQITWTDISASTFTQGQISVTRGIQYEQSSLQAGTMTVYVDNNSGNFTYGNVLSPYWPNIGDTDVPIRLRVINPGSVTPYTVMFSGYTDDIVYGVDSETYYGYAQVQASDAWSRLTQQMLATVENEALIDNPIAFISCNQTGANTVSTGAYAAPVQSILATTGQVEITTPPTASFDSGAIDILGATGLECWASAGTQAASSLGEVGYVLAWLPGSPLPASNGVTVEFWFCPVSYWSSQPSANICVCQALGGVEGGEDESGPLWTLSLQNSSPDSDSYQSFLVLTTGTGTYTVGNLISFYATSALATANYYIVVSWTSSSISVVVNPGDPEVTESISESGQSIGSACGGFTWGGIINQTSTSTPYGFGDTAIADISVFDYIVPAARSAARYYAGLTGFASESDNWRLARVTGYAGFTPVLAMRGTDLPVPPVADVDILTAATDTNTQVVSAYFTNDAQSTLALLYTNGPGALCYRRRDDWYNRPIGQYVVGEQDSQWLSLPVNPLSTSSSTSPWDALDNATLSSSSAQAAGAQFFPYCAVFTGDGVTADPFIRSFTSTPQATVTPGEYYACSCWVYSPQGWNGVELALQWRTSGLTVPSQVTVTANVDGGSVAYLTAGPAQAPDTAVYVNVAVEMIGTPDSTTQLFVANVQLYQVNMDYAGGAGVAVNEAPYTADYQVSSDRSQLYNYAQLTQYGQDLVSSFSGTSVLFTPTSGVVVTIQNTSSIALRGQVPYTATIYLNNTAQATPYYLNEGSIEDFGNWIVETLGSPLVHPTQVTLTPAATPGALSTGVLAEVGDTVVFRRRPLGAPEMQILTFLSQITQTISIESGTWTTQYQLSPFPGGSILQCDSVVNGVIDGTSLFGW